LRGLASHVTHNVDHCSTPPDVVVQEIECLTAGEDEILLRRHADVQPREVATQRAAAAAEFGAIG
jgi:hypothetical protein